MSDKSRSQLLEERTTKLAENIIDICRTCLKTTVTIPIIDQLIRSGTSIGANYREANGSSSRKEFRNKILICKKECKETEYWLQMLCRATDNDKMQEQCRRLWKETHEFTLIFSKSAANTKIEK